MKIKKNHNLIDDILVFFYSINLIAGILVHSTIDASISILSNVQIASSIAFFILSVFFKRFTLEQLVVGFLGILVTLLSWKANGADSEFFYIMLLIIGGSLINPRKILKCTAVITTLMLILLVSLSKVGVIQNLLFWREGSMRQSFGTVYPLIFAAYVFYDIVVISLNSFSNQANFGWAGIVLALAIFVNNTTEARNDALSLLAIALIFCINFRKIKNIALLTKIGLIVANILAVIAVFISKIVPNQSNLYYILDKLFSNRLYLQSILFNRYKIGILGQDIPQIGFGGQTANVQAYFYIDSSYTRIFFMGGIALFIIMLYILWKFVSKLIQLKLYRQAWIIIVVMLSALTEDSFSSLGVNILVPILMCTKPMIEDSFSSLLVERTNNRPIKLHRLLN
ncbi:hypothetical protein [Lactobacillus delbrueckii]|uniref:hypothetical protein n=1 Tax=Lactobacillus delbrueckii TaxID=1584 RepID=UPI001F3EA0A5|nr:hypothetical protein [Lactobacillus delbrueckii]GHN39695.1 hypothetical protein ME795_09770 [Lactobacillus delbrueckii]